MLHSIIFIILLNVFITYAALTSSDITDMTTSIKNAFGFTGAGAYGKVCNPCTDGDNIGALVRLVFHDAAGGGGPNGLGGMNGCLDFVGTTDHNGLQSVVATLNTTWTPYKSKISRADFWLLAGNVAIAYGSTSADPNAPLARGLSATPGTLILPFSYGRTDDDTCNDVGFLPAASFNWTQIKNLFSNRMGMTANQAMTILGAHTVGRCEFANSGFEGGWTSAQSSFGNAYYRGMGTIRWRNQNSSNVWLDGVLTPNPILLTIDVELLYSPSAPCVDFNTFTGSSTCAFNSEVRTALLSYTNTNTGNSAFFTAFGPAWKILTEFNYPSSNLTVIDATVTFAAASAPPAQPNKAALIGGIIGGIVGLAIIGGIIYYFTCRNAQNDLATTAKAPAHTELASPKLPPNWAEHKNEQGQSYYYNSATNETQWTVPEIKL